MNRYLNMLEENHPEPDEVINKEKLRYIMCQISIWDFFGIHKGKYLDFSQNRKSRMSKEYYKKLVLKYFSGKNISLLFLSDICLEIVV